jgi:integrase/recombinase XerD
MNDFRELCESYVEWLRVRNYSASSMRQSQLVVAGFAKWSAERGAPFPADITRPILERYQHWLYHHRRDNGKAWSLRTQSTTLSRLQSFFRWLVRQNYLPANPAAGLVMPRLPAALPVDIFSIAEVERVLAVADTKTLFGMRDRALLETFYSTGIRRLELVRLAVHDVDFEHGYLTVRQGKGKKDRVVPIGERALAWIAKYLEQARPQLAVRSEEWTLFLTYAGVAFHPDALGAHVGRLIGASGVRQRKGSCHLFRHTMATMLLEGGADVRYVQEMLGHASLETTQIYTKVSIRKLKDIHTAAHPGARLQPKEHEE